MDSQKLESTVENDSSHELWPHPIWFITLIF